jgi:Cu/Ag efflux protein CusF
MKKILALMILGMFMAVGFTMRPAAAQEKREAVKPARWSGGVVRVDMENSTLTVRKPHGMTRDIHFNNATTWTMKGGEAADKSKLKEGDRVVCLGTFEGNKFMASEVIVQTPQQ